MRANDRPVDETRPIRFQLDYLDFADGSALVECGRTRVLATATIEEKVPPFIKGTGSGWVTAEYAMLPRATEKRTVRERVQGCPSGRSQEIQRLIGRALRAVTDLRALGERQIILDCDVLQADGGTRTASITGAYVALALAVRKLAAAGVVQPAVLRGPIAAVSVGVVRGEPLLDLCYEEDSAAEVDMNVVMNGEGRYIEAQGTAERAPFDRAALDRLLDLANIGIGELLAAQREALG
jgi:ribonuclease PH